MFVMLFSGFVPVKLFVLNNGMTVKGMNVIQSYITIETDTDSWNSMLLLLYTYFIKNQIMSQSRQDLVCMSLV